MSGPLKQLPQAMRSLVQLAIAPNATAEMLEAAANSIVEATPLPALKGFVRAVLEDMTKGRIHD